MLYWVTGSGGGPGGGPGGGVKLETLLLPAP